MAGPNIKLNWVQNPMIMLCKINFKKLHVVHFGTRHRQNIFIYLSISEAGNNWIEMLSLLRTMKDNRPDKLVFATRPVNGLQCRKAF